MELHGAAATFQCLMDQILSLYQNCLAAYISDVIIFLSTWEQHLVDLKAVLGALQREGLTTDPQKCHLGQCETKYLGFVVGQG